MNRSFTKILVVGCLLCTASWQSVSASGKATQGVREHVARLLSENPETRLRAAAALGELGPEAIAALKPLVDLLKNDPVPRVRIEAARSLGAMGPAAAEAVPALVDAMEDHAVVPLQNSVAFNACHALGHIGAPALPKLIEILEGQQDDARRFAAGCEAVHVAGPVASEAVPVLVKRLQEDDIDATDAKSCLYALGGIGAVAKGAVPEMIPFLTHEDFHVRYFTARALAGIGPAAHTATEPLTVALKDRVGSVRRHAATALGNIGPKIGEQAVLALIKTLDDSSFAVRTDVIAALEKLGEAGQPAVVELRRVAKTPTRSDRLDAVRALWTLTGEADNLVPVLVHELKAGFGVEKAANVLADIGPAATAATLELLNSLKKADPITKLAIIDALGTIGDAAARPALDELLKDKDASIRIAAGNALKLIGVEP